ncbi:uncharacterized protein LOC142167379 [Nicotiana tabacum]|uniref:Uncharacterized protein LOC142167379 n=1 Tax=Nicotiana tabacum TaxID=4097 RepID=A0AC58SF86_TOBAC
MMHMRYLEGENFKYRKNQVQCEYYHYKGHTKKNCYKLQGYPSNFKGKKKGQNFRVYANSVSSPMFPNASEPRYQQGSYGTQSGIQQVQHSYMPQFVQTTPNNSLAAPFFTKEHYQQILQMLAKGNGEGPEPSTKLAAADFKYNLLSVSQLTKELQCMVAFFPNFCIFQDLYSGQVKGIGKEEHDLYILQGGSSHDSTATPDNKCAHTTSLPDSAVVWHRRLGHAPIDVIRKLDALSTLKTGTQYCPVCPVAKQTKLHFPLSTSVSQSAFDLVHCDIWGPYRVPSHSGKSLPHQQAALYNTLHAPGLLTSSHQELFLLSSWAILHLKREDILPFKYVLSSGSTIFSILDMLSPSSADSKISVDSSPGVDIPSHEASATSEGESSHSDSPVATPHYTINSEGNFTDNAAHGDTHAETQFDAASHSAMANTPGVVPDQVRKSFRPSKPPIWMQDYVVQSKDAKCSYPISTYVHVALAASQHWIIYQMNVHNAFLNGELVEEVYMHIPQGGVNGDIVIILVYVDDLPITGNNDKLLSKEGILMCQKKHALKLISEAGLGGAKPSGTPLELNQKLTSIEYDKCIQNCKQEESMRSVIGYLVKFGNALVSWQSKKQMTVSRSSVEVELRSMASCAA